MFRIVFPRESGASGSTPVARFGDPCTASQQLCVPRHFLRVTPHGVPLTSLVCFRRERSGRAPRSHIARAPSRAPSRRVNGRAVRFRLRTPSTLSCLSPRPTNRPERVALDRSSRTIARATRRELLQLSPTLGTSQRHKPPPLTSRATRGRSLGRPRRSTSLVKRIDELARAPVRCDHEARVPSCSKEQARPRSSTLAPRHPRHRRATFGDWVLLRVHAATQIELPRSGAFLHRFPREASASLEPLPPCGQKRRAFEKRAPESTPFFPTRAQAP